MNAPLMERGEVKWEMSNSTGAKRSAIVVEERSDGSRVCQTGSGPAPQCPHGRGLLNRGGGNLKITRQFCSESIKSVAQFEQGRITTVTHV